MFHPEMDGVVFRREHQLENKFIALYAGAHGMSNDLGVVLEAAAHLRDVPDLEIVLMGDGKEKSNLQRRAIELDLENLKFIASLPKAKMADALAASDVCIAILKPIEMYKTVYPNKVFDYMAAGRPVVLAIEGVIQEVIESAQAGITVPPGNPIALADAIRYYAIHRSQGITQGQNGRSYIETHFNRSILAQKFLELITQLAGSEK